MQPRLIAKTPDTPRSPLFWAIAASLLAGQLAAFWMLCSHQVRTAQVRVATLQVERKAVADCVRGDAGTTLNRCATRATSPDAVPNNLLITAKNSSQGAYSAPMSSRVPAVFILR